MKSEKSMPYKVSISKEAQIELNVAECFFKTKELHIKFMEGFFRQIQFLKTTPFSFQTKYKNIRIALFDEFNYSIHYVIENNQVKILRILNQRQDF